MPQPMERTPLTAILAVTLLLMGALCLKAQVAQCSLTGTVTDPQGNRVPGALLTMIESSTGLTRTTVTNSQGTYLLTNLPDGTYTTTVSKRGFEEFRIAQVEETVGRTLTLNFSLHLARGRAERTSVNEAFVQLDKSDAAVGTAIEREQTQELPLNGRNFASLTALTPGAIDNGSNDQRTIRFAGHGLDDNNITLDGVDATAIYNQEQREYVRLTIPLESVNEFQSQSQNFNADMEGGTAGGQLAVATPTGTNTFRGDIFDFFRNDALDSRSPFDGPSPDPFLLNQFGGNLGGPIVASKTFFYVNYEGLRQRLGQPQIGLAPSPLFISQAEASSLNLEPILQSYPHGTSATSNPNVWNYNVEAKQVDNEDSGMIRIDQHFSDRTTAFVRFNIEHAADAIPTGALNVKSAADTYFRNGVVDLMHVFSPALVNDAKFGINQEIYHSANVSESPLSVTVSQFSTLGGASTSDAAAKTFSSLDDVSWVKGKHILKVGYEIRWIQMNQGSSQSGTLTYDSPALLAANQADNATYISELPLKRLRKTQYWGYVQDEYKATENLTLTIGLRYNFFNDFHEVDNRAVPFDFASCGPGGYCPRGSDFSFPRYNDFDPRAGVAWSLGKSVLRVGGGIYHSDGQEDDQNLPISNDYTRYSLTAAGSPGLSFPLTAFLEQATGVVSPRLLDRNRKDMYVAAWTASFQQQLVAQIVGTATYLGNKGTDLLTTTYINVLNPVTGVRPYPAFGVVAWRGNTGNSTFHAFAYNAQRGFKSGWLLSANYMWSHTINDGSIGGGESDTVQDVFCRACDKASSDDDVRQVFNASAVYELPFGAGRRFLSSPGAARAILGAWELSGVGTARTGLPVNVTINRSNSSVPGGYSVGSSERPDIYTGVSALPAVQTPNTWINTAAFYTPANGTFGDLGRNALSGPGLWQMDAALSKRVAFTERLGLQFRAEAFNVFNRAQYGQPNANLSTPGNFGVITTTVNEGATGSGTPRQIQLGLRIIF
ncbi:MAG: TonB-dependent receptor [Bryobacteraceae bacterium]